MLPFNSQMVIHLLQSVDLTVQAVRTLLEWSVSGREFSLRCLVLECCSPLPGDCHQSQPQPVKQGAVHTSQLTG